VLVKKFWLQCPVFLKHPVSVFCVFSVLYSCSKTIVKLLCIWKACTQFRDNPFSCLENPHPSCVKYLTFSHHKQQGNSKGRLPISWD
jgi:hypothetical protein